MLQTALDIMGVVTDGGASAAMGTALTEIRGQVQGLEEITIADHMIGMQANFAGQAATFSGKLTTLGLDRPTGADKVKAYEGLLKTADDLSVPLSELCHQNWAVTYDREIYKGRGFLAHRLYHVGAGGALSPVPIVPPGVTAFNYRMGVPMLLYATSVYAMLVAGAMPWFRSAGMYAGQFRMAADAIDAFVLRMQDESLCRTEYTAQAVLDEQVAPAPQITPPPPFRAPVWVQVGLYAYPVGAFDLVRYDDGFLFQAFDKALADHTDLGQSGAFNYGWRDYDASLDLAGIAAAANERSRQDYADLQAATGMLRLISTAAWLRFLASPPRRSETVKGYTDATRALADETPAKATSPPIFPGIVIESPATLRRYQARGRAVVTTQEPGFVPAFRYRVLLRAIDNDFSHGAWRRRDYTDLWRADYAPATGDPRCKKLVTGFNDGVVLSEVVLYEGHSPAGLAPLAGTATMRASTFDWYAPVVTAASPYVSLTPVRLPGDDGHHPAGDTSIHLLSPLPTGLVAQPGIDIQASATASAAVLGEPAGGPALPVLSGPAPLLDVVSQDVWDEEPLSLGLVNAMAIAERRHVDNVDVQVAWQLGWSGGALEVRVSGRPQDRPFQIYVVVEETIFSGEIPQGTGELGEDQFYTQLHTAFPIDVVNQIVLVPEQFFSEERAALDAAGKAADDFQHRYAKSVPVGPGHPLVAVLETARQQVTDSPTTASVVASLDERIRFAMAADPALWRSVLARDAPPDEQPPILPGGRLPAAPATVAGPTLPANRQPPEAAE